MLIPIVRKFVLIVAIVNVVMTVVNVVPPMFATLIRAVVGNVMVKGRFT